MKAEELAEVLRLHKLWLDNDITGVKANLARANLEGATLQRANLVGANLEGANLEGANLEGATLRGANLAGANLARANLEGANLEGANLEGATLRGANLAGANSREVNTILQASGIGSARRMTTYWVEEDKVWCGCFTGTMAEFEAQVEKTHGDSKHGRNYRALIAYFKVVKK